MLKDMYFGSVVGALNQVRCYYCFKRLKEKAFLKNHFG